MSHPTTDDLTAIAPSAIGPPPRRTATAQPPPRPRDARPTRVARSEGWPGLSASLFSMIVHLTLLLILALIVLSRPETQPVSVLEINPAAEDPIEDLVLPDRLDPVDELTLSVDAMMQIEAEVVDTPPELRVDHSAATARVDVQVERFSEQTAPPGELLQDVGALAGQALEGRGAEMRGEMVTKYGGTEGSERAVAMALKWFDEHQQRDGSWTLDLRYGTCKGKCSQPGRLINCSTGATALAMLPFLGAGQTHQSGQYKETVSRGLRYLLRVQERPSGGLVSGGGSLYSHGLSAIVLCEAYAMTQDQFLKEPAQAALNYISFAQARDGGWRYLPQQAGDTSAVGWQLMALKSGHMGYLEIPSGTIIRVSNFLETVESDDGAMYGYNSRRPRPSTSAAGLLCRMYLGWNRNEPALTRGVQHLSELGPAFNEDMTRYHMYYNYYATQVMRHYGGAEWDAWNQVMREHLVRTQLKSGHMAGSWSVPHWELAAHDTEMGGRLYYTSLATMILEVYYRHMPIYSETANEEFPL